MERHFTVSGFVSDSGRTALHWHRIGKWLPPGGHIEPDEDPVQAVLREVLEETGIDVEVLPMAAAYPHTQPPQLPPPVTIGIYDLGADAHCEGPHQHIDFVYFTRPCTLPAAGVSPTLPDDGREWLWVAETTLKDHTPLPASADSLERRGGQRPIEDDVRELALASIRAARAAGPGAV